jgi:hypothetical protein
MKTDEKLSHIGAKIIFSVTCKEEFDNLTKSAFILIFSYSANYIIENIDLPKMAATFGKGGKYCKNQELFLQQPIMVPI